MAGRGRGRPGPPRRGPSSGQAARRHRGLRRRGAASATRSGRPRRRAASAAATQRSTAAATLVARGGGPAPQPSSRRWRIERVELGAGELGRPVVEASRLLPRQCGGRRRRPPARTSRRPPRGRRAAAATLPVAGEVGRARRRRCRRRSRSPRPPPVVRTGAVGGAERRLDRIADQGVHEAEPAGTSVGLDEPGVDGLVERFEGGEGRLAGRRGDEAGVELPTDDRRRPRACVHTPGCARRGAGGPRRAPTAAPSVGSCPAREVAGELARRSSGLPPVPSAAEAANGSAGSTSEQGRRRPPGRGPSTTSRRVSGRRCSSLDGVGEARRVVGRARAVGGHDQHRAVDGRRRGARGAGGAGVDLVHVVERRPGDRCRRPRRPGREATSSKRANRSTSGSTPAASARASPRSRRPRTWRQGQKGGAPSCSVPRPTRSPPRRSPTCSVSSVGDAGLADARLPAEQHHPGRARTGLGPPAEQGAHVIVPPDQGTVHGPDRTHSSMSRWDE